MKRQNGAEKAKKAAEEAAKSFVNQQSLRADPSGSYTGNPKEPGAKPEQDSDDL